MAIHLITGAPGHGKTLFAVKLLVEELLKEELADGSLRQVHSDIDGLCIDAPNLHVLEEPKQWPQLPDGCILVMDECQKYFPPRNGATKVPHYISEFETHRHHGKDVYLITQGPKLIDRHLWPLIDTHTHLYRPFGMKRARILKWGGVSENPNPSQNKANAQKTYFTYPKSLFDKYKSASDHTVKRRLPIKMFAIVALSLSVMLGLGGFAVWKISSFADPVVQEVVEGDQMVSDGAGLQTSRKACIRVVGRVSGSPVVSLRGRTVTLPASYIIGEGVLLNGDNRKVGELCRKRT